MKFSRRVVLALLVGALHSWSHLILKLEVRKLALEDFLGFGNKDLILGTIGVRVEGLASENPLLLGLPEAEREAAVDHGDVLVVGIEDVVWSPDRLPSGELDAKGALVSLRVELLGLAIYAIPRLEGAIVFDSCL